VVGGGDEGDAVTAGGVEEGVVASPSPGGFEALGRTVRQLDSEQVERDPSPGTQLGAEGGVGVRLGPSMTVVDVGRFQPEVELGIGEEVEEGDRVRATGERHEDPSAHDLGKI
jgi:hypothetical protein